MSDVAAAGRKVEVRMARVSADYKIGGGYPIPGTGSTLTYYRVIVDGKLVDSFQSRERAEARAAELRR